jgi:predicted ATP-dependent endonuclease of OLD family
VAYATHSEHFVDATDFETLRRFSKTFNTAGHPVARVTAATLDGVAERLEGVIPRAEIAVRIRINMRQHLEEAVFSRAAVVVEGPTDAAFLAGLASRRNGLDAAGIALVPAGGKTHLLLPWAILEELGVPTYLVFDGDADLRDRVIRDGKDNEAASAAAAKAEEDNRRILAALGAPADASPESLVTDRFTVFRDELEAEFHGWEGFTEALEVSRTSLGEFRGKSDDVYREAAATAENDPPAIFSALLDAIFRLPEA